jgi:hypothetical protein
MRDKGYSISISPIAVWHPERIKYWPDDGLTVMSNMLFTFAAAVVALKCLRKFSVVFCLR